MGTPRKEQSVFHLTGYSIVAHLTKQALQKVLNFYLSDGMVKSNIDYMITSLTRKTRLKHPNSAILSRMGLLPLQAE